MSGRWQGAYEAFGTRTAEDGETTERQMANTKEEDPTGLLNEGFRYRDLEAGVWLTRDPAGFVDGPNVYTYVRQNPWTYFDPLGLHIAGVSGAYRTNPEAAPTSVSLDDVQDGLSIAGMAPAAGIIPDAINTAISLGRGNWGDAAMNGAAMVPAFGQGATAVKWADKAADANKAIDTAVDVNKTIDKGSDATKAVDSSRDVAEEAAEEASKKGGKYKDVRSANKGGEVHHTPANSTNNVAHGEGPSIHMETTDHRKTASWGSSKDAQAYRKKQKELQKKGRRDDAIQMDIDDVKDKFGEKYDEAIEQMIDDLD